MFHPTRAQISLGAISRNCTAIADYVNPAKVICVLKANAYGHGLCQVARHLTQTLKFPYFAVAFLEEAIALREDGIVSPILVMGGIPLAQIPLFIVHDVEIAAASVEKLLLIDQAAGVFGKVARIHLKMDTGLNRIGIRSQNFDQLAAATLRAPNCEVVGVYSHLATADDPHSTEAEAQLERFLEATLFWERHGLPMPMRHIANSAAIARSSSFHLDAVRPGVSLYGVTAFPHTPFILQPALKFRSEVVYFKVVDRGAKVSYGGTWTATQQTRIVTVAAGYGDGYMRSLSQGASVLIRGRRYPVVGTICMDQFMVDIGSDEALNGDEVVLIGTNDGEHIQVEEVAAWAKTVPHEILTNISPRVRREYI